MDGRSGDTVVVRCGKVIVAKSFGNTKSLRNSLESLRKRIEVGFQPDTAAQGFSGSTASTGHCAGVAAIVYVLLGGEMVSTLVEGHSHWLNRISAGGRWLDVDLTGDQFGRAPVQIEEAGRLYSNVRVRKSTELTKETLERARRVAEKADILEAARGIDAILMQHA